MTRAYVVLAAIFVAMSVSQIAHADDAAWIWSQAQRKEATNAEFHKSFAVKQAVTSAVLRGVAESAALGVSLNGVLLAEVEPYDPLFQIDVTDHLRIGDQKLVVRGRSVSGPAAFFLQLDLVFADKSRQSIVTDASWQFTLGDDKTTSPAVSFGAVGSRMLIPQERQIGITAFDNYEQWRQAQGAKGGSNPASFLVSPGFEIQLVRSAQAGEDSWISLAFDPQGRAVIAKEKLGLLRMTLSADSAQVTQVETINNTLLECRGLLFVKEDLFADANNSKALYRLPSEGKDKFGEPQLLHASTGGVGHGRNDLAFGPDQQVYMIHGDSVDLPLDCVDHTSPFRDARKGLKTSEGQLLRIDPKGGKVHVLAAGLRNPFGIDFNAEGDVFTYDADAEHDMGAPWYRPTRVLHLVTGGDFGWRGVTGSWPPYYPDHPDNALPNLDIGKGSPTAVKFGTRSHFPEKFRRALFILDWAYGRIMAVHVIPRGSSYLMTAETFLKGRPLNVTDLDFGPDGSMYFVTGGRGTQSALYRVRYVGPKPAADETTQQEIEQTEFARQSRENRRHLESLLLQKEIDDSTLASVWNRLGDDDPWIRHAARNVLERQAVQRWQDRALTEPKQTIALEGLLALARAKNPSLFNRILVRLNELNWETGPQSARLAATYTYQLCLALQTDVPEPLSQAVAAKLLRLFPDRSSAVNQQLSGLLARFDSPQSVAKTVDLLRSTTQPAESLHYLFTLRHVKTGWTSEQRGVYFEALANAQNALGGAGMPDFLKKIRQEAVATLTEPERKALGKLVEGTADEAITESAPVRPIVRKWTVDELSDSLTEVAGQRDLSRGQTLFTSAGCIKCHRLRGHGRLIGPDLTSVPSRFSRRDILESIISPSKVIPEAYRSLQIVTTDGKSYVGRVALGGDYRAETLHLATDPMNPYKTIAIRKSDIELEQPSMTSLMPEGILNTLTREEVLDLLAFIERDSR
ncbi:MAG: Cytochrome c [Planctomycetaceae bacterium]|nr:Cytochrome c [Planctomycetaceae bacterium]